jgi:uncharacterized protein (DUF1697 family)
MQTCIAFLRGINVGGNKMLAMADLKALLTSLGYAHPRSLLQSGNLLFDVPKKPNLAALETQLETQTAARLKVEADFHVRQAPEFAEILASNPFGEAARRDPSHLVVMFFKKALEAGAVAALQGSVVGREQMFLRGRELYITYPDGIGTSKLTNGVIEKRLASRGTARNWNTLQKIAAALR